MLAQDWSWRLITYTTSDLGPVSWLITVFPNMAFLLTIVADQFAWLITFLYVVSWKMKLSRYGNKPLQYGLRYHNSCRYEAHEAYVVPDCSRAHDGHLPHREHWRVSLSNIQRMTSIPCNFCEFRSHNVLVTLSPRVTKVFTVVTIRQTTLKSLACIRKTSEVLFVN
jgi:hypothetical protein